MIEDYERLTDFRTQERARTFQTDEERKIHRSFQEFMAEGECSISLIRWARREMEKELRKLDEKEANQQ